jgi:hypothetical protein
LKKVDFLGNEELENKLRVLIKKFVSDVSAARKEREDLWDKYYRIWKSHKDENLGSPYNGRAKNFTPAGHRAVELFASRAPELLFNQEELVKLIPKNKTEEEWAQAKLNESKITKQFNATRQRIKWNQFFRTLPIYGTAIAAFEWKYDNQEVWRGGCGKRGNKRG